MKKFAALFLSLVMLLSVMSLTALADEPITLRVYDWSDSTLAYREQFHKEFMEKNPDIIVEYTQLTIDQFNSTVVNAIQSGDGPDLFPVPTTLNLTTAVNEGWFLDMEQYVSKEFVDSMCPRSLWIPSPTACWRKACSARTACSTPCQRPAPSATP